MSGTITDRIDGISTSVAVKAPVKVCAVGNVSLFGEQTIDGVSCVEGDRVLLPLQTSLSERGIYQVKKNAWVRDKDFDGARDVVQGTLIPVNSGTANGGKIFKITTANPITIGTTGLAFESIGLITQDYLTQITDSVADAENAAIAAASSAALASSIVSDGDRGDIVVSASGTAWTIDNGVVTNAKLANMPAVTLKANPTGSSAVPTDITLNPAFAFVGSTLEGRTVRSVVLRVYTANATWTKPANLIQCYVSCTGGGGAGEGGAAGGTYSGGGGGATRWDYLSAASLPASVSVTVGLGGAGTTGFGADGGQSSFGTFVTAEGGKATTAVRAGGIGGVTGVGSNYVVGGDGQPGSTIDDRSGAGGSSGLGGSRRGVRPNSNGTSGVGNTGQGGSGGSSTAACSGGNGGSGQVTVIELLF